MEYGCARKKFIAKESAVEYLAWSNGDTLMTLQYGMQYGKMAMAGMCCLSAAKMCACWASHDNKQEGHCRKVSDKVADDGESKHGMGVTMHCRADITPAWVTERPDTQKNI